MSAAKAKLKRTASFPSQGQAEDFCSKKIGRMHSPHQVQRQCRGHGNVARQRWLLLGKALIQGKRNHDLAPRSASDISVRRFSAYGLLSMEPLQSDDSEEFAWFQYTCPSNQDFSVYIRHLKKQFSPQELIGFNNTGNVCVWPSEEILTYHCLKNRELFREKTVCELGGGMTCLAGIAVASCCDASRVILTDGNELSCENVEAVIKRNKNKFPSAEISVRNLRWNEGSSYADLKECVDVILCADCLFFDQHRSDLVDTIYGLLNADGEAIVFAPRRGHTMEKFCEQAKRRFHLGLEENYDPAVWACYQHVKTNDTGVFDEDIHYPLKISLRKKKSALDHLHHNGTNGIDLSTPT